MSGTVTSIFDYT
ncbi:hypothetical protein F383_39163 [Gossypium arboreum]|uniref:Uncharacterized protein n=1 Tax=Gossypium arboreum TaxID=29729 RepID=A0A0B0ML68_GOSAR|nr:hypothetical protein F383_39163 [Gossypium arboreum]